MKWFTTTVHYPLTLQVFIWRNLKWGEAEVLKGCEGCWPTLFLDGTVHWRWHALLLQLHRTGTMVGHSLCWILILPAVKLHREDMFGWDSADGGARVRWWSLLLLCRQWQRRGFEVIKGVIRIVALVWRLKANTTLMKLPSGFVVRIHVKRRLILLRSGGLWTVM